MQRIILFVYSICIGSNLFAQSQQANDAMFQQVRQYFNAKQTDSLYALTSPTFQSKVDKDKFTDLSNNKLFPLGEITVYKFQSYKNGISSYVLHFTEIDLQMMLGTDKDGKIDVFGFRPYKAPVETKATQVPTSNPMITREDKIIDSIARKYIQQNNTVGLSIGILKDGKTYTYGYGGTAKGNAKLPDGNTIFEIGSITKTFTSTLLAWYVNEHKLKLSDPITKFLPDSVAANKDLAKITLLMLANHTSGLTRMFDNWPDNTDSLNPYKSYDINLLFSYLKTSKLENEPGTVYSYSNTGAGLLGIILEKISGKTYEQMVKEIICRPLEMNNTIQHLSSGQQNLFTSVYDAKGDQVVAWDFDAMASAGALRSSADDLLKYAAANLNNTGKDKLQLALELTHHISFDKVQLIGLGWHYDNNGGAPFLWHNGGTYGSSSFIAFMPDKQIAIVVLSNSAESVDETARSIFKLL